MVATVLSAVAGWLERAKGEIEPGLDAIEGSGPGPHPRPLSRTRERGASLAKRLHARQSPAPRRKPSVVVQQLCRRQTPLAPDEYWAMSAER